MSDIVQFRPAIVGDGAKLDAAKIIGNLPAPEKIQSIAVAYLDEDGELKCCSTDSRAETLMLFERAKARLIAGYED